MINATNKPILPINQQTQNKIGYLLIGLFVLALLSASSAYLFIGLLPIEAQTATSSPTSRPTSTVDSKINELKERIATQVARLDIIKKRGVVGKITDLSNNQIVVEDIRGNKRFVDVDELTKFQDTGERQIGISDLKKGDQIEVVGLYNTESRRILARFVKKRTSLVKFLGEVMEVDQKNFILEVAQNQNTKIVEVETITKIQQWTKSDGLAKSGFSKIEVGEKILIVGFEQGKDKIIASRILLLPEVSPNIKRATPSSTGSGTKKP